MNFNYKIKTDKINIMNNNEKIDINKCIKFIKKYINIEKFTISKIDINTKLPYYNINVLYSEKNTTDKKTKQLFSEYIIEKDNNSVLHYFTNNIEINILEKNNDDYIMINSKYILKFFYYEGNWITNSEFKDFENHFKKTFNNLNDIYEILNKDFYYNYIIKNEKLIFISKGKTNNIEQFYNELLNYVILDNNKYILYIKNYHVKKEKGKNCEYELKCINPKCYYDHPLEYDLNESYKQYIIEEKIKKPMFKSTKCKNGDDLCVKHKCNKCNFRHKNDPIDKV